MFNVYSIGAAIAVAFVLGVFFSAKVTRFFAVIVSDVKKDYALALEKTKALYDADTQALEAKVKEISTLYDTDTAKLKSDWAAEVAKLKADLGDANTTIRTLVNAAPAPVTVVNVAPAATAPVRTKAQIAADLATAQAAEAALQADYAAATE